MQLEQISLPFPPHKVKLKAIKKWGDYSYSWTYPSVAVDYLCKENVTLTVIKQREMSVDLLIECSDSIYERIKLDFVRNMGDKFIWKD